jgi:hypothetical protein
VPATSTAAARKAGAAAAGRLFLGAPRPPRALRSIESIELIRMTAEGPPLSVGPVFDVVIPSAAMAPCCLCCGSLLTWEKLAFTGYRLPLARGGFYACCDVCDCKNQAVFTKEWQTSGT